MQACCARRLCSSGHRRLFSAERTRACEPGTSPLCLRIASIIRCCAAVVPCWAMVMLAAASAKGCARAKVRAPCTLIEPTQGKVASITERASACVRARRLAFLQADCGDYQLLCLYSATSINASTSMMGLRLQGFEHANPCVRAWRAWRIERPLRT